MTFAMACRRPYTRRTCRSLSAPYRSSTTASHMSTLQRLVLRHTCHLVGSSRREMDTGKAAGKCTSSIQRPRWDTWITPEYYSALNSTRTRRIRRHVAYLTFTCGRLWYRLNCPQMLLSKVSCSQHL